MQVHCEGLVFSEARYIIRAVIFIHQELDSNMKINESIVHGSITRINVISYHKVHKRITKQTIAEIKVFDEGGSKHCLMQFNNKV